MTSGVAAIIPAFNEEKNIEEAIKRTRPFVDSILVIDDGSRDRTGEIAKAAGAAVISHQTNRGKGEALRTGFDFIKGKKEIRFIVIIDADLQLEPEQTPSMLSPLTSGEADLVMGARNWSIVPARHRLGNMVWRNSFNALFGTSLLDTNCGFVALTKEAALKLDFVGGYIIEISMLASARKAGFRIKNVPVNVNYHKISGVKRGIRVVLGVLIFIWKEGIKYRLGIK